MYDTGFKVLSMKIKYFAPFKHKYQSLANGMKECEVANFHGQTSDVYAYA
jgi:hypothetical protein